MSDSSIFAVPGFRWSGVCAGIKKREGLDLALLVADEPVPTAAVFTTNQVKAAPVLLAADRVKAGLAQAVLINSGCANACTGTPGMEAAKRSTAAVAKSLGVSPSLVLPASTGVIGQLLPADKIEIAAPSLVQSLSADSAQRFSEAILTTDRGPKISQRELKLGGKSCKVLGIAKGAGMIHPNMATTLAVVVTDAAVSAALLRKSLRKAISQTFNAVSVDGDTSTNDTVVVMASGRSGASVKTGTKEEAKFAAALETVLEELADMLVADGEGAEHVATFEVVGAVSEAAARKVAHTICTSPLVKTALHGKDPNWGRILAAAGRAGVKFNPDVVEIRIGEVVIVRKGLAVGAEAEKQAHTIMTQPSFTVRVKIGAGKGRARYKTCDFGTEYVRINADYRS